MVIQQSLFNMHNGKPTKVMTQLTVCKGRYWELQATSVGQMIEGRMQSFALSHKDIKCPRIQAFFHPFEMDCQRTRVKDVATINTFLDAIINKGSFMSSKTAKPIVAPKKEYKGKPVWGGFCNVILTPEQKEDFHGLVDVEGTSPIEDMMHLMSMGKLSAQVSEDRSITVTLTVVNEGKQWALSAFAEQLDVALAVLCYKVHLHPQWYTTAVSATIRTGIG
jgi:hypothetical protein